MVSYNSSYLQGILQLELSTGYPTTRAIYRVSYNSTGYPTTLAIYRVSYNSSYLQGILQL